MRDNIEDSMVTVWAKVGDIMRDKMADKKVIVWSKVGGIMKEDGRQEGHSVGQIRGIWRHKIDNMVIVWAMVGGIMQDKMADVKVIMWPRRRA